MPAPFPLTAQVVTTGEGVPDWVGQYAAELQALFNLQMYAVTITTAPNPHGINCGGAASTNVRYLHAEIELRPPLPDTVRSREIVAHEMLEVLFARLGVTLIPYFEALGDEGEDRAREHYLDAKEPIIQALARVIVGWTPPQEPTLPPPPPADPSDPKDV